MWNSVVTNSGIALMSEWIRTGGNLAITGAYAGTGTVPVAQLMGQTDMAGDSVQLQIISQAKIDDGAKFSVQLQASINAYTAMQIGIWASLDEGTETLIAIYQANSGEGIYVPAYSDMPDFSVTFNASMQMDNTGDYSVTIDTTALVNIGTLQQEVAKARPRGFTVSILYGEWSNLSEPNRFDDMYYYDIEDASITEDTCVVSWSLEQPNVDFEYIDWEASDGKIRISAPMPGFVHIYLWVEEQLDGLPFGRIYSIPLTRYNVANDHITTAAGYVLDARQGKWLNDNKEDKLTWDSTPTTGSTNPVTSGGTANAIAAVTPVIYDKVLTGVSVSSDNGYSAAIPYSTFGNGIVYDKIIGCFFRGWAMTAVLAPQVHVDGLYIYSTKAFADGNVHVRLVCLP